MNEQIVCEVAYETGYINGYNNALEEFAERLKERAMQKFDWNEYVEVEDIDNLVKEMVVDNSNDK